MAEAQNPARELGGYVNPTALRPAESGTHAGVTAKGHAIYAIDFDLAVVVATEGEIGAGAKLQVASIINIGGSGRSTDKHQTTSRVKFVVHVTMPVDTDSTEERTARETAMNASKRQRNANIAAANLRQDWRG